ncbi:MAG: autotransporter-associated beta strand repeat-containing protein, partial [Thermoguttaceae bacterium]
GTLYMNLANDYLGTTTLNAGKTVLGNATALGSASAPLIIGSNATLDLNVMQLYTKPVTVQGAGADGVSGAIVNNNTTTAPAGTQYDIGNLTLSGNTTIGGISTAAPSNSGLPGSQYIGRWALRAQNGSAYLHTTGAFSLTKTGNNQIMFVNTIADAALADINVKEGVLSIEGSTTLGNSASTITVDGTGASQPAGGSILQLRNLSSPLNKQILLKNNGQLYAILNGTDTDNTVSGTVTISTGGGILNAGGLRDDYPSNTPNASARLILSGDILGSTPMIKRGPGTVILSSTSSSFNGTTSVEDGTLIVNGTLHGSVTLHTSPTTGVTTVLAGIGTICGTGVTVTDAPGIIIAPGPSYSSTSTSVGTLTVADMTFDNASTLSIELNGTAAGQFDVLNSTGTLALQGACTLAVTLGYTPANGDSFDIINWGTLAGPGFGTLSLPALPDSLSWDTSNLYTIGSIAVIPEPAALLMLIMAAGLGLMLKRFRNR